MKGVSVWKTASALLLAILLAPAARAATFVVGNTNDSGPGSLRQAIADANANPATTDTIVFNIPTSDPGFDGATFTIRPSSELPVVLRATTIDGTMQTAFTGDTNPFGPEIVLDGSLLSSGSGLRLSDDNVVRGLVIQSFPGAAVVGTYTWDSNPSHNRIEGNYLGTDATGTLARPNGEGADFHGFGSPFSQATGNVVRDNLISGNQYDGISLCDADRTEIVNNLIGTDRTGSAALGNGREGIAFYCAGSPRNLIQGNTIAWNGNNGILDAPDYRFGVSFTLDGHQGNHVTENSIHSNGGLGIDVLPPPFPSGEPPFTPTPNDACDGDTGGNLRQNFPEITRAERAGSTTIIEGFLNSTPNATYTIELFASAAADPSGAGEGETFLSALSVTTDSSCLGNFSVTLPVAVPPGHVITATATDGAGNTSEFSWAVEVESVGDTEPPEIVDLAVSPNVLWPPNHKMRAVTVSVSAIDAFDPSPPVCQLTEVTSNEPANGLGDGDTAPDWLITGNLAANLRAERSGNGTGRIYTLAVTCSDAAGNTATGTATVTVPHSQGH